MDPLQWMGAVRMRVLIKTANKYITIIHMIPVHQLTFCEVKNCVFVRNKSIIKMFLTSNVCFRLKYESSIQNISPVKRYSHLNQEWNIYRCLQTKTFQNSSKQICKWILMWKDNRWWTFPWRKNYYWFWTHILSRNDGLNLKCLNDGCVC